MSIAKKQNKNQPTAPTAGSSLGDAFGRYFELEGKSAGKEVPKGWQCVLSAWLCRCLKTMGLTKKPFRIHYGFFVWFFLKQILAWCGGDV